MAFMMPVVKNEWDIYKTNRSRRSSECSNPQACRSRKRNVILTTEFIIKRLGVLEIGGPVVVDVAGLGLPHLARARSLGTNEHAPLLAHVIARLPVVATIAEQEHRLIAPEDRKLLESQQISQSSRGQAQALAETRRRRGQLLRSRGRSTQPLVKRPSVDNDDNDDSGSRGSTATVRRLEAHRDSAATRLGTDECQVTAGRRSRGLLVQRDDDGR